MTDSVQVHPAMLRKAKDVCGQLRDMAKQDEQPVHAATVDAARGVSGWVTAGALEQLAWWWQDDVDKLSGYLDKFGNALGESATAYEHSDQASAGLFDIRGR